MKHCVQATHWRTSRDRDRAEKNVQCTEAHTLMGKASRTQWKKIRKQNENKNEKTVKNSEKWEKRDFEWMTRQWKQCRQKVVAKVKKHWITTSKKRRKREKKLIYIHWTVRKLETGDLTARLLLVPGSPLLFFFSLTQINW